MNRITYYTLEDPVSAEEYKKMIRNINEWSTGALMSLYKNNLLLVQAKFDNILYYFIKLSKINNLPFNINKEQEEEILLLLSAIGVKSSEIYQDIKNNDYDIEMVHDTLIYNITFSQQILDIIDSIHYYYY